MDQTDETIQYIVRTSEGLAVATRRTEEEAFQVANEFRGRTVHRRTESAPLVRPVELWRVFYRARPGAPRRPQSAKVSKAAAEGILVYLNETNDNDIAEYKIERVTAS